MAFNSIDFILFLTVAFAVFWGLARWRALRLTFLLLASYLFYSLWNGELILLIAFSTVVDLFCGHMIYRTRERAWLKRSFFALSLLINLGLLGYFKYANFFVDNFNQALSALGYDPRFAHLDIILPVGISFYTFQSLSYTIDIYQGTLRPVSSWRDFFLFVAFFPQLIAGPIVRASEFLPQLAQPAHLTRHAVGVGVYRLLRGFAKKMLIADYLAATIVDPVFATPEQFTGVETFLALVAFHFQVYCDFSGYTDIAIGAAALFGFSLPENFNKPYLAFSPSDYWRRWHMTLSRFCFDYIYKPLGGSKGGELRTYLNNLITFGVIGFWHGANWNYVLFGVYHALAVIASRVGLNFTGWLTKTTRREQEQRLAGKAMPILLTNLVIIGSLPLFRSPDLPTAWTIYSQVITGGGWLGIFGVMSVSVLACAFLSDVVAARWPNSLLQRAMWALMVGAPIAVVMQNTYSNMASDGRIAFGAMGIATLAVAVLSHLVPIRWEGSLIRRFVVLHPAVQAVMVAALTAAAQSMASMAQQSFVYFQF